MSVRETKVTGTPNMPGRIMRLRQEKDVTQRVDLPPGLQDIAALSPELVGFMVVAQAIPIK